MRLRREPICFGYFFREIEAVEEELGAIGVAAQLERRASWWKALQRSDLIERTVRLATDPHALGEGWRAGLIRNGEERRIRAKLGASAQRQCQRYRERAQRVAHTESPLSF